MPPLPSSPGSSEKRTTRRVLTAAKGWAVKATADPKRAKAATTFIFFGLLCFYRRAEAMQLGYDSHWLRVSPSEAFGFNTLSSPVLLRSRAVRFSLYRG